MEKTCDYSICTGCRVCAEVCPIQCISFQPKEKGHHFPKINTLECIDCKKCERTCPALKEFDSTKPTKAFAAIAKDIDDYQTTTSGGAAQTISKLILQQGGVVYGCAVLPGVIIKHIRVDNIQDLDRLKGSKYVQSDLSGVFSDIRTDVASGRKVLFIGVPCQVAAISSLFKKRPDNLILVDLICHGVPSQLSLIKYLRKHVSDISTIDKLKFRTSRGFQVVASKPRLGSHDEEIIYESIPLSENPYGEEYYSPFFYGYSYRASCYTCHYAKPSRISDITIGDFWGLNNNALPTNFPDHKKGISIILPVSEIGKSIVGRLENDMYMAERPVEEAIKGNRQLRKPTIKTSRIKIYELLSQLIGIKAAFKLMNLDRPIRKNLRPYKHKIKGIIK